MDEWDQLLELANLEAGIAAGTWVSVAEAGKAANVSRSALRSWYRNGEVPSTVVDGPHGPTRMLPLEAVVERARRSPRIKRKSEADEVAALRARVDDLERRLAALEATRRP